MMICELSLPPKQKNAILFDFFLLCVQIDCTCGDYLCGEVKTQLRMCQRIGNMPKACPYAMAMSVFEILDYKFNYLKRL